MSAPPTATAAPRAPMTDEEPERDTEPVEDNEPRPLMGAERKAFEAAKHPDDHLTFDQLVTHGRHLFGYPTWAVEAALVASEFDRSSAHHVDRARDAIVQFMKRVEE